MTLLNHANWPNCVKLPPKEGTNVSKIISIRNIAKGDELTVSYLHPTVDITSAQSAKMIKEQFGFEVTENDSPLNRLLESPALRVDSETSLSESELEGRAQAISQRVQKLLDSAPPSIAKLEAIRNDALTSLSPRHIVILGINKLIVDIASNNLQTKPKERKANHAVILKYSLEVLETLNLAFPSLHPDRIQPFAFSSS